MKIAKETAVIAAIGLADLLTTIVFIEQHGAQEANPVFRQCWEMGLVAFVIAKLVFLIGPLSVLEWARARRPRFVSLALKSAIVSYLALYAIGVSHLNTPPARANELASSASPSAAPASPRALMAAAIFMSGRVAGSPLPDPQTLRVLDHHTAALRWGPSPGSTASGSAALPR